METSYISMVTNFKQRPSKSVKQMARGKDSDILQNDFLRIQSRVSSELLLDLHVFYFTWSLLFDVYGAQYFEAKKKRLLLSDIIWADKNAEVCP